MNSGSKKRMYIPLDLATLPGVELLSKQEKELCVTNRMLPAQFFDGQTTLMKLSQREANPIRLKDWKSERCLKSNRLKF